MMCDDSLQFSLLLSNPQQLNIQCSKCYQTIHCHISLLSQSVDPIHCLDILLWIPIWVIQYNSISCTQIDSKSSWPCCEQKQRNVIWRLKLGYLIIPICLVCCTVYHTGTEPTKRAVVFQKMKSLDRIKKLALLRETAQTLTLGDDEGSTH